MVDCAPGQYRLTISSVEGGEVVIPGEGTFSYDVGTVVDIVAEAEEGYEFVNWTGDVGTIGNVNTPSTNITMNGNHEIIANFRATLVTLTDPTDDLFDKSANSIEGEPYLDIVEAEVSTNGSDYVVTMKMNGSLPQRTPDSQLFYEWDIFMDADSDPITGVSWPLIFNNLHAEYMPRLGLLDSNYWAQLYDLNTRKSVDIEYTITDNIIELRWSRTFNEADTFNFVVSTRKYGERGASTALILADKAPDEGYYNFPDGYVQPPQPGLPTASLEATYATVFYNLGNGEIAREYGAAFDFAYAAIGKELGTYPKERFTLYVYLTQEDLVQGLQEFSGFSPGSAAYFKTGGAPRPINYIMHVSPGFNWHGIAHEYIHTILEEISGNAYKSVKWLDEGLAEYLAYSTVIDTKYKESELSWGQSTLAAVQKALQEGKFLNLSSISTESQWSANHAVPEIYALQYAESYAVVTYLAQIYGVDKCVSILKLIHGGDTEEIAVQKALGVSLSQIEVDFKDYLQE
jgi:hypothetical protein